MMVDKGRFVDDLPSSSKEKKTDGYKNKDKEGQLTSIFGTGDNAKDSFVWISLRYSFIVASLITLGVFLMTAFSCRNNSYFMESLPKIWDIFVPIITLALGYAFGRGAKSLK
jgi:hypothetical protein